MQAFDAMSKEVGISLPKGAGPHVDAVAAEIIERFGLETLAKYTKQHFANTEKALKMVKKVKKHLVNEWRDVFIYIEGICQSIGFTPFCSKN